MKVIAQNRDIIYSTGSVDSYSAVNQKDSTASQLIKDPKKDTTSTKKKVDWKKASEGAKKFGTFLKDTGLADMGKQAIANKLGVQSTSSSGLAPETTTQVTIEENKPMSTGVKVAIGVGVAAVLGFIIYKATKK